MATKSSDKVRELLVPERLNALEELHNFTFSDAERGYLLPLSDTLLTPIDNQKRYITAMALQPMQCPACKGITCQRAAADDWDLDRPASERKPAPTDSDYHCPLCYVQLTWSMDLFGGPSWFSLAPGQTIGFTIGQYEGKTKREVVGS